MKNAPILNKPQHIRFMRRDSFEYEQIQFLKKVRRDLNLTQAALANMLKYEISKHSIHQYETGKSKIPSYIFYLIERLYKEMWDGHYILPN